MIHGVDTSFIVASEVVEHPRHVASRKLLSRSVEQGIRLALAPQILAEFVHVVTDARRFERPLAMEAAMARVSRWWNACETKRVFPCDESVRLFFEWMQRHRLGRKRLLDTLLVATYVAGGIRAIITVNPRDFGIPAGIEVIVPMGHPQ